MTFNIFFQTVFVSYTDKKNVAYHSFAMYIYSLNKYLILNANACSYFLKRVTALHCSSRVFATWRELCKFLVDSLKFTVSHDIFEDDKVNI